MTARNYTVLWINGRRTGGGGVIGGGTVVGGDGVLETEQHHIEGSEHTSRTGAMLLNEVITPTQLVANTDNWNPTDLATADVIRASTDASRNLTGIIAPTVGRAITLENIGAFDLVLMHDVTSTAANRFYCLNDEDITLQPNGIAILVYDTASARWRVFSAATDTHIADATDAHDASAISFTPNGSIAATDVQAAIQEVRDEASGIPATIVDAKGDLIAATAADTVARVAVGTDGYFLKADTGAAAGVSWAAGSAGSGDVATDTIWDAAGDTVVGSGANTAIRLAIGAAGGALSRVNGAVAWNSGTSFPTAATGDRYWRTDLGMEFFWNGTRWLCTCPHNLDMNWDVALPMSGASAGGRASHPGRSLGLGIWAEDFWSDTYVVTTNDGTRYWTIGLDGSVTLSTISNAANTVVTETAAVDTVFTTATLWFSMTLTRVGATPGSIYPPVQLSYRFIGT